MPAELRDSDRVDVLAVQRENAELRAAGERACKAILEKSADLTVALACSHWQREHIRELRTIAQRLLNLLVGLTTVAFAHAWLDQSRGSIALFFVACLTVAAGGIFFPKTRPRRARSDVR